jgi:hypothetical protein
MEIASRIRMRFLSIFPQAIILAANLKRRENKGHEGSKGLAKLPGRIAP